MHHRLTNKSSTTVEQALYVAKNRISRIAFSPFVPHIETEFWDRKYMSTGLSSTITKGERGKIQRQKSFAVRKHRRVDELRDYGGLGLFLLVALAFSLLYGEFLVERGRR